MRTASHWAAAFALGVMLATT
ncbi:MAG: hypothetical protein QOG74_96, partial [Alphaproteobacteria bacterium]|nr:hypothetical protein [Alphaproteobacteria bacterium]